MFGTRVCFRHGLPNAKRSDRGESVDVPLLLPLDIVAVDPPTKVPMEFARCCEHDTEQLGQAGQRRAAGGRGGRTDEEKQGEMIIVSSRTHITPSHTAEHDAMLATW